MDEKIISISTEEIHKTLNDWSLDFFKKIENEIGKEITASIYKKALLHCLGFVDYNADISTVLSELNILEDIQLLDLDNKLNIEY